MKKLPKNFDGQVFVGRTLETISFAAFQVNFWFDKELGIQAETTFKYQRPGHVSEITIPVTQSDLMPLLEHQVAKASVRDQHILTIEFDNGHALEFSDTAPGHYESYSVTVGDEEIIV